MLEKQRKQNRIDVHTHYLPPAYYAMLARRDLKYLDGGMPCPEWNAELHLKNMEALSVSEAWLSVSSPHLHMGDKAEAVETARGCNEFGAELTKKYPGKFRILASLPLPEVEEAIEEVRYCSATEGIDGFALITNSCGVYLGDPSFDPVMEELNKIRAVVSIHPTQPGAVPAGVCEKLPYPLMEFFFDTTRTVINLSLNRTFQKFPDIRFIVPHAGAVLPIMADRLGGLSAILPELGDVNLAEDLKRVYFDLAGMSMPKQYELLLKITDTDHLLYGSDGTFTPPALCERLAEAMDEKLGPEAKEKIYQRNPDRLMGV